MVDIRSSDHEQLALPVSVLGPRLREGIDVELLVGSSGYIHRVHSNGRVWQLPHNVPSMDRVIGVLPIPVLAGPGVRPRLSFRLVVGMITSLFVSL